MKNLLISIIILTLLVSLFSQFGWTETEPEQGGGTLVIPSGMAIIDDCDLVIYEQAPTTQAKKSNSAIAYEVINGKWGNGAERKKKLTAAGYNYKIVQAIVNDLLAQLAGTLSPDTGRAHPFRLLAKGSTIQNDVWSQWRRR